MLTHAIIREAARIQFPDTPMLVLKIEGEWCVTLGDDCMEWYSVGEFEGEPVFEKQDLHKE